MKMMKELMHKSYITPETHIIRLQVAESLMWELNSSSDKIDHPAPARIAPAGKLYL